ncbi:MAG: hypothetical protein WAK17_04000 [Candidatus Nitrosopolaris sp.]
MINQCHTNNLSSNLIVHPGCLVNPPLPIRPGPVVLANDAILGMNEFGQMKNIEDNKYFTDAAEEGYFTATKHGVNIYVIAHPSFIWTANPISGRWRNPDVIDAAEFPIIAQWGDRMDFIIPFIEKTDESSIKDYVEQRRGLLNRLDSFASTTLWLKKYLLHTRPSKPNLSEDMRIRLEDFLVAIAKHGVRGLPRKLEALERTAIGFAKLKLKDSVDEEDVSDTINLFNEILKFYKQDIVSSRDMTFLACLNVYEKTTPPLRTLDDVIQEVCSKNDTIAQYIGKVRKSHKNHKIKDLKPLFNQHPNIHKCGDNPTAYLWVNKKNGTEEFLSDPSDVSAKQKSTTTTQTTIHVTNRLIAYSSE